MQVQKLMENVLQAANSNGGLWTRDKILLKIMEEVGELSRAFRRKDRVNQGDELGDVLFACLCLALREGFDPVAVILRTIQKADAEDVPDKTDKVLVNLRVDHGTKKPVIGAMWIPVDRSLSDFQAEVTELRNVLIDDTRSGSYSHAQLIELLVTRGYEAAELPGNIIL